ncbi:growth arrest and DNA damage-inducible protein GADD45 beta-like [Cynoglossus semilaevis]|uniref:Growth arrest and DNA damage inducible beta n=1 Tax=Cynoglossus semilaevis TaxID=244447 RepID=A0A3P8UZ58_CYNSE|nr:growth arrest and DNA damage-inducible protein GADD45 beta-like [Cynoglossus semilaevis]
MIPEENFETIENRTQSVSLALEELLVTALKQDCLTIGIYESAKLFNADPDSVVLCVLAADDEDDVALQIHFTLLQAFCCDSGITILRVSGVQRLQQLLGSVDANRNQDDHRDLHCMLVTNHQADHCRLQEVGTYCQERRRLDQWVPELVLQER